MIDIKKAIKAHGWTIAKVAEEIGITQSALSQQINNKSITFVRAAQVAKIIGCSVSSLMNDDIEDFTAFIKCNGVHYTADSLRELNEIVDELNMIAK